MLVWSTLDVLAHGKARTSILPLLLFDVGSELEPTLLHTHRGRSVPHDDPHAPGAKLVRGVGVEVDEPATSVRRLNDGDAVAHLVRAHDHAHRGRRALESTRDLVSHDHAIPDHGGDIALNRENRGFIERTDRVRELQPDFDFDQSSPFSPLHAASVKKIPEIYLYVKTLYS